MPHLSLPVDKKGMAIEVRIGVKAPILEALVAAGKPVPSPISARGFIDSGSDVTALSKSLLLQLNVPPDGRVSNRTASGVVEVDFYRVSLTIAGPDNAMLAMPNLLVTALATELPEIDVLIGL